MCFFQDLFGRGLQALQLNQCAAYYHAVLLAPDCGRVLPNLKAAQYKALMKDVAAGGTIVYPVAPPPLPPPLPPPPEQQSSDDDGIIEDGEPQLVQEGPPEAPEPQPVQEGPPASQMAGDGSEAEQESSSEGILDGDDFVYPDSVNGHALHYDEHAPRGRRSYKRLRIECPVHEHCFKYRGVGVAQRQHYGFREPVAFLAVWVAAAPRLTVDQHKAYVPSRAEIAAWLASN